MNDETKTPTQNPGTPVQLPLSDLEKVVSLTLGNQVVKKHKERLVIGSVVSADLRVSGPGIAPIHAVIEVSGIRGNETAKIFDLASEAGVYVNDQKVVTQALKTGDRIRIGPHVIEFKIEDLKQASVKSKFNELEGRRLFLNPKEDLRPLLLEESVGIEEEIFDYRPTAKQAIEVVLSWKGTILDVQHFVDFKDITIGPTHHACFGIPDLLGTGDFPLVMKNGGAVTLNLSSKMNGVFQAHGKIVPLSELVQAGPQGAKTGVAFNQNDFAKVSLGDIDFYLSYTAAPPRLKRRRLFESDVFFLRILIASGLLSTLVLLALLNINVPQTVEIEKIPERMATVLYEPERFTTQKIKQAVEERVAQVEKPKTPPPPKKVEIEIKPKDKLIDKPIPKEMDVGKKEQPKPAGPKIAQGQNMAKEGEGARAKGKEGVRGTKNAKPGEEHQKMAKRASPTGGEGRGGSNSQVNDEGNLEMLKGATSTIQNLLAGSSEKLGGGGKKVEGFGGFNTQGEGGLGLSGKGAGGGGTADTALGGLGEKGKGGGRVGTGLGAAGEGSGIVGGRSRVAIRTGGPEETVVMGNIDPDAIEAAMQAHRDLFKNCYEREVNQGNPKLGGRISTSFVIGPSGKVSEAGIVSSSINNSNVESCVLGVIRQIDFPIPRGGGTVQVRYPFKFQSTGG